MRNNAKASDRLRLRIEKLEIRKGGSQQPMSTLTGIKSNPYWGCSDCHRADPALSVDGHGPGCQYSGIDKEIAHYKELLKQSEGSVK